MRARACSFSRSLIEIETQEADEEDEEEEEEEEDGSDDVADLHFIPSPPPPLIHRGDRGGERRGEEDTATHRNQEDSKKCKKILSPWCF